MAIKEILVVDDEIGIRELLSEILFDEGYGVHVAESAVEARAFRNQQAPDLVLLDIWMPDTDGITLLKEWGTQGLLTMPVMTVTSSVLPKPMPERPASQPASLNAGCAQSTGGSV